MNVKFKSAGFSLVELLVAMAVLGVLASIAIPSFQKMFRDAETRNAAESIVNGLQKARGEAVSRNANVEFVLGVGTSWQVNEAGGAVIESRDSGEGSAQSGLAGVDSASAVATKATFNSFGSLVANADASNMLARVDVSTNGGDRHLRVVVGVGGSIKMCDPGLVSGSSARAC